MRINLYLTPSEPLRPLASSAAASSSSSASNAVASVPKPLLALSPNGELILVELQGSLEMELQHADVQSAQSQGEVIGEFIWGDGKEDKPTLLLSHHRLEGKLVNLPKPLAVIQKRKRVLPPPKSKDQRRRQSISAGMDNDANDNAEADETLQGPSTPRADALRSSPVPGSSPIGMRGGGGAGLLQDSDESEGSDAESGDGRGSPSMQRKRARLDASLVKGPSKSRPDDRDTANRKTPSRAGAGADLQDQQDVPSSSPAPLPPMRGSALDFSSPPPTSSPTRSSPSARTPKAAKANGGETGDANGTRAGAGNATADETNGRGEEDAFSVELGERKRPTATYYDVMCIVRKKVLFSKRPEPVVHAQGRVRK